jgi:hypothetical protein
VYYLDMSNAVNEMAYQPGWVHNNLKATAALGSALACFGWKGSDARVYFLDPNHHVNELAFTTKWQPPFDITGNTNAAPAAAGSDLGCFGVGGELSRIYHLDANAALNEMAYEQG